MDIIKLIFYILVLTASIHFLIYASKHDYVPVIHTEDNFILRYPKIYLWICIIIFMFAFVLIYNAALKNALSPAETVGIIALLCVGTPMFLLAVVWKIRVLPEYIIFVNQMGIKRQIYYKDIRRAILTPGAFMLDTTIKTYRFTVYITYLEYFLKRLNKNGVKIERLNF